MVFNNVLKTFADNLLTRMSSKMSMSFFLFLIKGQFVGYSEHSEIFP